MTYKATPEPWQEDAARWLDAILELRARVEALEAISRPFPNSSQIGSSLVDLVAVCLNECGGGSWDGQARAVIREVAAWMTSNPDVYFPPALVFALEQETER